jgi:hypothetical protein
MRTPLVSGFHSFRSPTALTIFEHYGFKPCTGTASAD